MPELNEDNSLKVSSMYLTPDENSKSELYPVIVCKNNNDTVIWSQPLIII
jgi:hypothetical protein